MRTCVIHNIQICSLKHLRHLKQGRCARCIIIYLPLLLCKNHLRCVLSIPLLLNVIVLRLLRILPPLFSLLARELTKVAILAEAECVVGPFRMRTVVSRLRSSPAVVTSLTVSFCVKLFVCVRTHVDCFGPFLIFLNLDAHLFYLRIQWPPASLLSMTLHFFFDTILAATKIFKMGFNLAAFFFFF